ncbi:hypothetical protein GOODEAATRI_005427 [Goodea atripinnis]|uniref:Alpha-macroglobulin-like TED domain-containing protein n=1 Tax=Goodea atripinnis TaxID=208336 RepID=A0ABV0PVK1_9TELE
MSPVIRSGIFISLSKMLTCAICDVSLRVRAEALRNRTLCGNSVATVPEVGRIDTVIDTLLVEVSESDLMGRALQNLDKLLAMPYGCGEQNMLLFAPNIFILNYLKSSGQLTDAILEKAKRFLESGEDFS